MHTNIGVALKLNPILWVPCRVLYFFKYAISLNHHNLLLKIRDLHNKSRKLFALKGVLIHIYTYTTFAWLELWGEGCKKLKWRHTMYNDIHTNFVQFQLSVLYIHTYTLTTLVKESAISWLKNTFGRLISRICTFSNSILSVNSPLLQGVKQICS